MTIQVQKQLYFKDSRQNTSPSIIRSIPTYGEQKILNIWSGEHEFGA